MNENYFMKQSSELSGQTNLPSFLTFESNLSRYSTGNCLSDSLFTQQRTHENKMYFAKEEDEDDSGVQGFVASDSSISTPDIMNSIYTNNNGLDNQSMDGNIDRSNNLWLKVEFMSPSSFFYKDINKPSNGVKLSYVPKREYPILYVEKGRVIELTAETNFCPPPNSVLKFDIFSLKGTREEPVYGSTNESASGHCALPPNMSFIQATEEQKVSAYYMKSDDGSIAMIVPLIESPYSLSVVFPFLNFKCQTSSKKIVFLRISVLNGVHAMASQTFQLVCCTSPNRDFKRHFEKLNSDNPTKSQPKKSKVTVHQEGTEHAGELTQRMNSNPQYVIMTESYDIWKILDVVHQQLKAHFNSSKK